MPSGRVSQQARQPDSAWEQKKLKASAYHPSVFVQDALLRAVLNFLSNAINSISMSKHQAGYSTCHYANTIVNCEACRC